MKNGPMMPPTQNLCQTVTRCVSIWSTNKAIMMKIQHLLFVVPLSIKSVVLLCCLPCIIHVFIKPVEDLNKKFIKFYISNVHFTNKLDYLLPLRFNYVSIEPIIYSATLEPLDLLRIDKQFISIVLILTFYSNTYKLAVTTVHQDFSIVFSDYSCLCATFTYTVVIGPTV